MGSDDGDTVDEKLSAVANALTAKPPLVYTDSLSPTPYVMVSTCVVLWLVLGTMAVCIYFAAKSVCGADAGPLDTTCTLLAIAGSVAASVFVLSCCVMCAVVVWRVMCGAPTVRYVRVDQEGDA
jgi:hypothetical protein